MSLNRHIRAWYRATLEEDVYLALRVALTYLVFGALWILLSDRFVASLVQDAEMLSRLQTVKGWLFVVVTAVLIHLIVWSAVRARRKLRIEKRESQRFLDTLIENLPGMVYSCRADAEWTLTFVSPGAEELTGYPAAELMGPGEQTLASLAHELDRERIRREAAAAIERRRPFQLEYRLQTRCGEVRWVWAQGQGVFDDDGELRQIDGFVTDVTARRRAEDRIVLQVERLRALRAIDKAIMGSMDLQITLDLVLDQITRQLGVDAASILTFDSSSDRLHHMAGRGFRTDAVRNSQLRLGEGAAGRAALRRETLRVDNIATADDVDVSWLPAKEAFVSYFAVPLVCKGQLVGVLELLHRSTLDPDESWTEFLETLAGQTAIAIDNAYMLERLQRANAELRVAYEDAIEGWARALDLRDHETEGHSRRVMEMAVALAERMGVEGEKLLHIRHGALLHDIGKLGVPDSILLKEGPLNDEETEEMRRHPEYAVDLLASMAFLEPALDIPHYHHERWDGTGYPHGMRGEEIPLAARIFAVVDVWDALLSDRPYRAAWSEAKAWAHIREQAGSHFDPDVVDAFFALLDAKGEPAGSTEGVLFLPFESRRSSRPDRLDRSRLASGRDSLP